LQESLQATETQAELIAVVDEDDELLPEYQALDVEVLVAPVGTRGLVWPLNYSARLMLAEGYKYFFNLGDDHRARTLHWDKVWEQNLDELGTGIVYGDDLFQRQNLPTQVGMTRDIVEAINGFVPAVFDHLYCDDFWLRLGDDLGCIRYLPETVLEHMHPIAGKAEWDTGYRTVNSEQSYARGKNVFQSYIESNEYAQLKERLWNY
jgi:hypothetical protein